MKSGKPEETITFFSKETSEVLSMVKQFKSNYCNHNEQQLTKIKRKVVNLMCSKSLVLQLSHFCFWVLFIRERVHDIVALITKRQFFIGSFFYAFKTYEIFNDEIWME